MWRAGSLWHKRVGVATSWKYFSSIKVWTNESVPLCSIEAVISSHRHYPADIRFIWTDDWEEIWEWGDWQVTRQCENQSRSNCPGWQHWLFSHWNPDQWLSLPPIFVRGWQGGTLLLLLLLLTREIQLSIVADILVRVWSVLLTIDVSDTSSPVSSQTHLSAAHLGLSPHLIMELLLHLSLRDSVTLWHCDIVTLWHMMIDISSDQTLQTSDLRWQNMKQWHQIMSQLQGLPNPVTRDARFQSVSNCP